MKDKMRVFEIVICLKKLDSAIFATMLHYVESYIQPKGISIITQKDSIIQYRHIYSHIHFIDEDSLYPNLSYHAVQDKLLSLGCSKNRAGWYLQQFLKMAYAQFASSSNGGGVLSYLGRGRDTP